jgi:hypothetical protein
VAAFDGASSRQLWPEPGKVVELPGAKLVRATTLQPNSTLEPVALATEEGKYTHLGVTANYPDPSADWRRSFKIEDVQGRAILFHRSTILDADKGAGPPASDGR